MPKTNDYSGATYAGSQGVVEHGAPLADGRRLSELDPERHLDGTLVEGDHPDAEDRDARETADLGPTDPEPQPVDTPAEESEPVRERTEDEKATVKSNTSTTRNTSAKK